MKIEAPNENKIIVELSDEDMMMLDITYDEINYSNIETRRVIWTILDKARTVLGKDIDPSKQMVIETLPLKNGGCMIFFTVNNAMLTENAKNKSQYVYEFDSINNVIDFYDYFKRSYAHNIDYELYSSQGRYRLITKENSDSDYLKIFIKEYAHFLGKNKLLIASTQEYWKKEMPVLQKAK